MPMAAASLTSTTATEMTTVETGQTSLTAVSALAGWEEGQPDRGSSSGGRAQVPAWAGA